MCVECEAGMDSVPVVIDGRRALSQLADFDAPTRDGGRWGGGGACTLHTLYCV